MKKLNEWDWAYLLTLVVTVILLMVLINYESEKGYYHRYDKPDIGALGMFVRLSATTAATLTCWRLRPVFLCVPFIFLALYYNPAFVVNPHPRDLIPMIVVSLFLFLGAGVYYIIRVIRSAKT